MRRCGDCQLCCRLLPVVELGKSANTRCRHQRVGKGCTVYHQRSTPFGGGMPMACKLWSCRWLVADDTSDLARPDRSHYVVDIMPDFITAQDGPESVPIRIGAVQVWVDPHHPGAHRDPALRAFLARRGEEGLVAIIRYGARDGFTLIPPTLSGHDKWLEIASGVENGHSIEDLFSMAKVKRVQPAVASQEAHAKS